MARGSRSCSPLRAGLNSTMEGAASGCVGAGRRGGQRGGQETGPRSVDHPDGRIRSTGSGAGSRGDRRAGGSTPLGTCSHGSCGSEQLRAWASAGLPWSLGRSLPPLPAQPNSATSRFSPRQVTPTPSGVHGPLGGRRPWPPLCAEVPTPCSQASLSTFAARRSAPPWSRASMPSRVTFLRRLCRRLVVQLREVTITRLDRRTPS